MPVRSTAVKAMASDGVVREAEVMLLGKISVFQPAPVRVWMAHQRMTELVLPAVH